MQELRGKLKEKSDEFCEVITQLRFVGMLMETTTKRQASKEKDDLLSSKPWQQFVLLHAESGLDEATAIGTE